MTIELTALQQQRRDTAANWTSANPTLLTGEIGYETDTGKFKIGNGSTVWTGLAYLPIPDNNGLIPASQLLLPLGSASAPSLAFAFDTNTGIFSPPDALGLYGEHVAITTAGTQRVVVDSSGKVGIGITPQRDLHIHNASSSTNTYLQLTSATTGTTSNDGFQLLAYGNSGNKNAALIQREAAALEVWTSNTEMMQIDSSGNVFIGGTTASSADIVLYANGSATFSNIVYSKSDIRVQATGDQIGSTTTKAGITLYQNGAIHAASSSGTSAVFTGLLNDGNSATSQILANGSATFAAGAFAIASDGDISTNVRCHGTIELDSTGSFSSPKIKLFSNTGAATFADDVNIGNSSKNAQLAVGGVYNQVGLAVSAGGAGYSNCAEFYNSSNVLAASIGGDGAATFASTVQVGGNPYPGTATGFAAYIDGSIALSSASASGTILFGYTTGSSTQTTTIKGNGSATFADTVMSLKLNGYGFLMANPSNTAHTSGGLYQTGSGQSFLYLKNGFNTSPTITIDGAAGTGAFSGTVSAQGSVLTSDQRFKKNITDANAQLADVTALGNKLRNWDWTADAPVADKDTRFLGLVAQEAETICPGIVTTIARTKDGAELTPEVVVPAVYETKTVPAVLDDEGKVVEAETTEQVLVTAEQVTPATYEKLDDSYKGIKDDILIMKLLGAVAELSAEVAALKAG